MAKNKKEDNKKGKKENKWQTICFDPEDETIYHRIIGSYRTVHRCYVHV